MDGEGHAENLECPHCGAVLANPGARGAHISYAHLGRDAMYKLVMWCVECNANYADGPDARGHDATYAHRRAARAARKAAKKLARNERRRRRKENAEGRADEQEQDEADGQQQEGAGGDEELVSSDSEQFNLRAAYQLQVKYGPVGRAAAAVAAGAGGGAAAGAAEAGVGAARDADGRRLYRLSPGEVHNAFFGRLEFE